MQDAYILKKSAKIASFWLTFLSITSNYSTEGIQAVVRTDPDMRYSYPRGSCKSSVSLCQCKLLIINNRVYAMKRFCIHQDKQSPFYGTVGHIADPDDLLGTSRTVCQGIFDPYDLLGVGHGCRRKCNQLRNNGSKSSNSIMCDRQVEGHHSTAIKIVRSKFVSMAGEAGIQISDDAFLVKVAADEDKFLHTVTVAGIPVPKNGRVCSGKIPQFLLGS